MLLKDLDVCKKNENALRTSLNDESFKYSSI